MRNRLRSSSAVRALEARERKDPLLLDISLHNGQFESRLLLGNAKVGRVHRRS